MVKEEDCHPPVSYSKELRNRFVLSDKSRIVHRPSSISPVTARLYRSCRTRQALRDQDTLYEDELVQLGLDDDDQMYSRPRRTHRSARHVSRSRRNTRPHSIMRSMRPQRHSTQILEVSDRARRSLRSSRHSLPNGLPQQRSGMANGHMSTRGSRRREGEEEEEEAEDGEDDEGEEGEDEEEEAEEVADEEDSHEAEGVRRSTRQRKLLYDNFNTSWILGTQKLRGYPMFEDRQEPREERKVEGEECQSDNVKEDEESAKKASIMEQNSDERLEKLSGLRSKSASNRPNTFYEDMYTRVKRHRRPPKQLTYQDKQRKANGKMDGSGSDSQRGDSTTDDGEDFENTSEDAEGQQDGAEEMGRGCRSRGRSHSIKYRLRQNKPRVERFQVNPEPPKTSRYGSQNIIRPADGSASDHRRHKRRSRRHYHRRHWRKGRQGDSDSSSSSSSESSDRSRSGSRTHNRCMPINYNSLGRGVGVGGVGSKKAPADVDPMILDTSVRFEHVGGLEEHIRCLKEIVVFPMLYKEIFEKFKIQPPKGVLFYGPPGTGKTLIARALANECSQGDRRVAFFMRKGADCLSKWVGESERQLRLLFEQAYQMRPSIIFFDELDGLAPVRSSRQDQIHASIVSTLLALMDGLDSRGEVVVIGATNRIDAIDPALRRPGRFDRELYFPLPARKERQEILKIHVSNWAQPPTPDLMCSLAEGATGYCGSDLRALCSEAVIKALQRRYPQIYRSSQKLQLDPSAVQVEKRDFLEAKSVIVPASHRAAKNPARRLSLLIHPLLHESLLSARKALISVFPWVISLNSEFAAEDDAMRLLSAKERMQLSSRFLLVGDTSQGHTTHLAPALLHSFDHIRVHTLDICTLYEESGRSAEEAVIQVFREAQRYMPSIIYMPNIAHWWGMVHETVRAVFLSLLQHLEPGHKLLLLATAEQSFEFLPMDLASLFSYYKGEVFTMRNPNDAERENFFRPLFFEQAYLPVPDLPKSAEELEELPAAPPPEPPKLTEEQLQMKRQEEEVTLRELRIFLREICAKLARNRQFFMFTRPVDIKEVPDYRMIIKCPMDLETMMTKIDQHSYECARDFLADVDLICRNALEYNPDRDPADKLIRHRAYALRDTAYALIKAEMDSDFEDHCRSISKERKKRIKEYNRQNGEAKDEEEVEDESNLNALYFPDDCPVSSTPSKVEASSNSLLSAPSPLHEISNNQDAELTSELRRSSRRSNDLSLDQKDIEGSESRPKKRRLGWARGMLRKKKRRAVIEVKKEDGEEEGVKQSEGEDNGKESLALNESESKGKRKNSMEQSDNSLDQNDQHMNGTKERTENHSSSESRRSSQGSRTKLNESSDHSPILKRVTEKRRSGGDEKGEEKEDEKMEEEKEKMEEVGEEVVEEECRTVSGLDEESMRRLLDQVVQITKGQPLDTLVEFYSLLEREIGEYAHKWKRHSMLKSLQSEILRFKEHVGNLQ